MALLSRRRLIVGAAAVGLSGCEKSSDGTGFLAGMEKVNDRAQSALFDPARLQRTPGAGELTAKDGFPAYKIAAEYPGTPQDWAMEVGGMVKTPRSFSLDELMRMPRTSVRVRHYCVEGWSAVSDWHGVRVSDVAAAVGADPKAGFVEFTSFEQEPESSALYFSSWDRRSATHPQTLLAYGKSGELLDRRYGAPLRLYSGIKLGYKNVKYLASMSFLPEQTGGYWENLGYEWFAGT